MLHLLTTQELQKTETALRDWGPNSLERIANDLCELEHESALRRPVLGSNLHWIRYSYFQDSIGRT